MCMLSSGEYILNSSFAVGVPMDEIRTETLWSIMMNPSAATRDAATTLLYNRVSGGDPVYGDSAAADILEHIRQSREEATNGTPVEGYVEMAPRTDDGRADDGFIPLARGISNPRALNINRATAVSDLSAQTKALLARRNANALDDDTSDSDSDTSDCPPLVDPAESEGTS